MERGYIRQRGTSSYAIQIYKGRDPKTGKKLYHRETIRRDKLSEAKKAAQARLTELLRQLDTGSYVDPVRMTVADLCRKFLQEYADMRNRPLTRKGYKSIIETHIIPELGHISITKLQPLHLQESYRRTMESGRKDGKEKPLSATTVLHHHTLLHKILAQAVRWGLLGVNVADRVDPPKAEKYKPRVWSWEEGQKFLEAVIDHRLFAVILLTATTGMRRGEVEGLKWEHVHWEDGFLEVVETYTSDKLTGPPKSDAGRRRIDLTPVVLDALWTHKVRQNEEKLFHGPEYEDQGLVFCKTNGQRYHPDTISSTIFPDMIEKAGVLRIRFHDLRHTHFSQLAALSMPPKTLQLRAGHASSAYTLNTYSHRMANVSVEWLQKNEQRMLGDLRQRIQERGKRRPGNGERQQNVSRPSGTSDEV